MDSEHDESSTHEARRARRFCQVFCCATAACLAAVALLNFLVNPFAQYPTRLFVPAVQLSRSEKLALLTSHQPAPEGLVLGSSRVMKLEPEFLRERTGVSFFNAGVNYALPEDHLALLRWYQQHTGQAPRMVILGLDVYTFSPATATDPRLLNHAELVAQIPDCVAWSDRFHRWTDLLAWQQTRESARSLVFQLRHRELPPPDDIVRDDGLLVYRVRERELAAGVYDFEEPLQFTRKEYEARFSGFDHLSPERCRVFEKLARTCRRSSTRLIVFLTPLHPRLRTHLARHTDYEARRAELMVYLQACAQRETFVLFDATDIAAFGGDPDCFVDGIHPLEANTRRLIDVLVALPEGTSTYAVQ